MNNNKIPTYDECVSLCSTESPFYETSNIVDGFIVKTFNYRMAQASDFDDPKAREMRGITFVFDKDGTLYKRYILLDKFFNLNQVPNTMYSVVKDYKIKSISNKEDGSIASFIKLPNGKIIGKSKIGFDNIQCAGINRIYKKNTDIKNFVNWAIDNDLVAIFEYVAPHNRIVLKYNDEELILLKIRDNNTGAYLNIKDFTDKLGSIKKN